MESQPGVMWNSVGFVFFDPYSRLKKWTRHHQPKLYKHYFVAKTTDRSSVRLFGRSVWIADLIHRCTFRRYLPPVPSVGMVPSVGVVSYLIFRRYITKNTKLVPGIIGTSERIPNTLSETSYCNRYPPRHARSPAMCGNLFFFTIPTLENTLCTIRDISYTKHTLWVCHCSIIARHGWMSFSVCASPSIQHKH